MRFDVVKNGDIVFVLPPADPPTTVAAGAVWQAWVDSDTWASLTSYRCCVDIDSWRPLKGVNHLYKQLKFRPRTVLLWRTVTRTSATCTLFLTPTHIRAPPTPAVGKCTRSSQQVGTWPRPPARYPTIPLRPTALLPNRLWTVLRCSPSCPSTEASTSRAVREKSRQPFRTGSP